MHKSLSYVQKLEVIEQLERGITHQNLAAKYGVSRTQITSISKKENREKIIARCLADPNNKQNGCRSTRPKYKLLEDELLDWFVSKRQKKFVVTTASLRAKALLIRDRRLIEAKQDDDASRLHLFLCSNRWIGNFKKRNRILLRSVAGTEDTLQPDIIAKARDELKESLGTYDPRDIYNADESGLFYRQLPDKSLVLCGVSCKEQTSAKDRVTILLCCSATGDKLKPLIIGSSSRPRALKNLREESIPCIYRANQSAWLTRMLFEEWLQGVNTAMISAKRKICLILDNFSGHILQTQFSNVRCVFLPPGMTSVLQPLDCGIIRSFKAKYKQFLALHFLNEERDNRNRRANIREAIEFASKAWEGVTSVTIKNCWHHAGILQEPNLFEFQDLV
jgi:hypothetical protein